MGDRDSIYGFAAVGLEVIPAEEDAAAGRKLRDLADGGYAVIYITERLYKFLEADIAEYQEFVLPAIIPIPGASGSSGMGVEMVKKSVERAVGSDILFGNEKGGG
jgi:V/A-type H+-transporting ATPase subunit F